MSEKELLELGFTKEFSTDIIEDEPDYYSLRQRNYKWINIHY